MKLITLFLALIFSFAAFARDVNVRGYTRRDGTYVAPHVRSSPDSTRTNNYGDRTPQSQTYSDRDKDNDGIYNQYDSDDDNDGINDDYDKDH
jgi:hypothetical protein